MSTVQGMSKGEHQYGKFAEPQKHVSDTLYRDFTSKALDEFLLSSQSKSTVRLADFGASDCMTTSDIYAQLVKKGLNSGRKVEFYIVDLPGNDWDTAEQQCALSGIPVQHMEQEEENEGSKFVLVPQSFYSQCLPRNSINISFTSTATHWLSSVSALRGSIYANSHAKRINVSDLETWKKISYIDGVNFLVSRANELEAGGTLLMANVNREKAGLITVFEIMNEVLAKWAKEGKLLRGEVDEMVIPVYNKNVDEWKACFDDERVKLTGLKLQRIEQGLATENQYFQNYSHKITADQDASRDTSATTEFMKFFLAFAEGILLKVLKTDEKLSEFIGEVGNTLVARPDLCEECKTVWYSDLYVAVKE